MVTQSLTQALGHQADVARARHEMLQAGQQFLLVGKFGGQSHADTAAQRDQFLAPQLLGQACVTGQDNAQQRLGIELGSRQQAKFREHHGVHLLGFVDEQHHSGSGRLQMRDPALAQGLEATLTV